MVNICPSVYALVKKVLAYSQVFLGTAGMNGLLYNTQDF